MLLQHAVRFHKARDWICLQDQNQLTYASLLQHCKTLDQRCEQYQKAQIKGRAELTTLSAATARASSVHQDNVTLHNTQCTRCGYKHPLDNCPAKGKECYNCHGLNHYTALCRCPKQRKNSPFRTTSRPRYRKYNKSRQGSHSPSKHRQSCHRSPSPTNTHRSSHQPRRQRSATRSQQVSHITSSTETSVEGKLHTDVASDGHTSFHTTLQIVTKQGSKPLPVKVDHSADVNTIPLTKYRKLFPAHFTKAGNLKQKALHPTRHTWTAHDETPQQFLGYFIADIHHKTKPEVLPIRFYVFKDTTSPKILLSYAASERLGIVKVQIPNEAPSIALDTISTKKHVTFRTPLHTYRPVKPKNTGQHLLKPAIKKQPFQDQTPQKQSFQGHPAAESSKIQPFQDHSEQKNALQDHSRQDSSQKQLFQDHFTTDDVHDIIAMKKAFPKSFDLVGNMPGTYTIWLDPSVPLPLFIL